jgi:hypothetical protein
VVVRQALTDAINLSEDDNYEKALSNARGATNVFKEIVRKNCSVLQRSCHPSKLDQVNG